MSSGLSNPKSMALTVCVSTLECGKVNPEFTISKLNFFDFLII
jgi:hypothetical protein